MMEVYSMYRRIVLLVAIALCVVCASQTPRAVARPAAATRSVEGLVSLYYQILNAGMRSGDFSAMAAVYSPDATLVHSTPQGATATFQGLPAIIAYYHRTYLSIPGIQFIRDKWYGLSPTIVLNYEHTAGTALRLPARCSHLFVLRNGKIHQVFWVTYFAGVS
jgi:hypothetical protein